MSAGGITEMAIGYTARVCKNNLRGRQNSDATGVVMSAEAPPSCTCAYVDNGLFQASSAAWYITDDLVDKSWGRDVVVLEPELEWRPRRVWAPLDTRTSLVHLYTTSHAACDAGELVTGAKAMTMNDLTLSAFASSSLSLYSLRTVRCSRSNQAAPLMLWYLSSF